MTGDIHGDPWRFWSIENFCNNHKTTTDDWLICLGDVGLNYYGAKSKEEISLKNEAAKLPIKMFCIHGNHERRPSESDGYKQVDVSEGSIQGSMMWNPEYPNQYFAIDGAIYKIKTPERWLNALVCGGAYSVDKYYRLQNHWNWWPDEQPNELIKGLVRLMVHDFPIDIMLTHTCPLRFEPKELFLDCIDQSTVDTSTEEFFDDLYEQFPANKKPMWYFGHFHGDKYTDDYVMLFVDIIELK
jgi:3-oxoacid CoA-transferase subunit A